MRAFMQRRSRRVVRDEDGSVTVEFVIIFPLLIFALASTFVFFDAFLTTSRASKAAYTIGDIVSREDKVTPNMMQQLFELQENLIPNSPAGKWLRITSIQYIVEYDIDTGDPNNDYYIVNWSRFEVDPEFDPGIGDGDPDPTRYAKPIKTEDLPDYDLPTMADKDTVILVETYVPYEPPLNMAAFDGVTFAGLEWRNSIYNRPRSGIPIEFEN